MPQVITENAAQSPAPVDLASPAPVDLATYARRPQVIITESAAQGLERCRRYFAEKKPQAARRAAQAIKRQFMLLDTNPVIGRPLARHPQISELAIGFEDSSYIAFYRYEFKPSRVYVLAFCQYMLLTFRHWKES